jgi:flagellar assembly protein FliH
MSSRDAASAEPVALWRPPAVDAGAGKRFRGGPTVARLEAIEREAFEQGFAAGREQGLQSLQAEIAKRCGELDVKVAALDAVLALLAKPLADLDASIEREVSQLALAIAKQLVRRELRVDPTQVIGIVRHTVSLLPVASRDIRVHLHPEDAAIVNERLAQPNGEREWVLVEDPLLARGSCRVTTNTAAIDARLEARLAAAAAVLLGEERATSSRADDGGTGATQSDNEDDA